MPFPGIPAGSALEAKIDRCVNRVMATGRDKSAAIAICRASTAGTTQKSEQDAIREANYRDAGPASTQTCATCRFGANAQKQCSLFKFTYKDNWTCNRWRPNIEATRNRLRDLQMDAEKRKQWIEQAKERIALKREIPQRVRRDLGRGDFVFPETRSFPIIKPEDVRAAVSSWGRASTARARGFNFDDFKRRLTAIAKRKGAAFVAALPADWKQGESAKASFSVFKDASGQWRWVMRSSSAYQDKDGEIVSTKALTRAVEIHDQTGDRGPLRWWHVKDPVPVDLGTADFGMMHGKILVESGTFPNEAIGAAIAEKAHLLEGSIGFHHPTSEPVNGVFENIAIFERSLLPRGRASNLFTALNVYKESHQMNEEKIKALKALIGDDLANQTIALAEQAQKEADGMGITFKELAETELSQLSADALLEYALAKKEYEEAQAQAAAAAKATHPGNGNEDEDMPAMMRRVMKMLENHAAQIKELQASRKEAPAAPAAQPEPPSLYKEMDERLKALESDQPPALQRGYRASEEGTPIQDEATQELTEREKAMKAAMEKNPEIAPFAHVGAAFGAAGNPAVFGSHPYWGAPWQQPPNATPPAK